MKGNDLNPEKEPYDNEQFEIEKIKGMIDDKGGPFVEQKFFYIINSIREVTKKNVSVSQLYSQIFPDLVPTLTGIKKVFENAIQNVNSFAPIFHSSEFLYNQWLINFSHCDLVEKTNGEIIINYSMCKECLEEFHSWVAEYPELKGSFIRTSMKRDIGDIPMGTPITYTSKNSFIRKEILKQLEKHSPIQTLYSIDNIQTKLEIKLESNEIILIRKSKYPFTPKLFQTWLGKFGITVSLLTTTYLIEFGMPYGGDMVPLDEILRSTNNGYGIIGLLAFQLALLIIMQESGASIEQRHHPLRQSVVLGLARLEHYLNPTFGYL